MRWLFWIIGIGYLLGGTEQIEYIYGLLFIIIGYLSDIVNRLKVTKEEEYYDKRISQGTYR